MAQQERCGRKPRQVSLPENSLFGLADKASSALCDSVTPALSYMPPRLLSPHPFPGWRLLNAEVRV